MVLKLLSSAEDGVHTVTIDEYDAGSWSHTRVAAMDDVVTLSRDDDDKWAKSVIANAERLTGIKVNQDGEKP